MLITDPQGDPVELDELDAAGLLEVLGDNKRTLRAADRDRMRLVHQWCVLHPATRAGGIATWHPDGLPGDLWADESLGGQGCLPVAASTPAPLAAVLGPGKHAATQLIADALDLCHRLPRCWLRPDRRGRATRADRTGQDRIPVPATSPLQDHRPPPSPTPAAPTRGQ